MIRKRYMKILVICLFLTVLSVNAFASGKENVLSLYAVENSLDGQIIANDVNILRFYPVYAMQNDIDTVTVYIYYGSKYYQRQADEMEDGRFWRAKLPEFQLGDAIQRLEVEAKFKLDTMIYERYEAEKQYLQIKHNSLLKDKKRTQFYSDDYDETIRVLREEIDELTELLQDSQLRNQQGDIFTDWNNLIKKYYEKGVMFSDDKKLDQIHNVKNKAKNILAPFIKNTEDLKQLNDVLDSLSLDKIDLSNIEVVYGMSKYRAYMDSVFNDEMIREVKSAFSEKLDEIGDILKTEEKLDRFYENPIAVSINDLKKDINNAKIILELLKEDDSTIGMWINELFQDQAGEWLTDEITIKVVDLNRISNEYEAGTPKRVLLDSIAVLSNIDTTKPNEWVKLFHHIDSTNVDNKAALAELSLEGYLNKIENTDELEAYQINRPGLNAGMMRLSLLDIVLSETDFKSSDNKQEYFKNKKNSFNTRLDEMLSEIIDLSSTGDVYTNIQTFLSKSKAFQDEEILKLPETIDYLLSYQYDLVEYHNKTQEGKEEFNRRLKEEYAKNTRELLDLENKFKEEIGRELELLTDTAYVGRSVRKSDLIIEDGYKRASILYRNYKDALRQMPALDPAENMGVFRLRYVPFPITAVSRKERVRLVPFEGGDRHVVFEFGLNFGNLIVPGDQFVPREISIRRLGVAFAITEKHFEEDAPIKALLFSYEFNSYASIGAGWNFANDSIRSYYSLGVNQKVFNALLQEISGVFK